jgi:hypothetical protein
VSTALNAVIFLAFRVFNKLLCSKYYINIRILSLEVTISTEAGFS